MPARALSALRLEHRDENRAAMLVLAFAALACGLGGLATQWPVESAALTLGLLLLLLLSFDLALGVVVYIVAAFTFLGPKPNVTTAMTALVLLGWVARATVPSSRRLRSLREVPAVAIPATLLAAWLCTATLWAGDLRPAENTATWFICDLLLFGIFYAALDDERRVRWALFAIVVGGGLAAAAALAIPSSPTNQYGGRVESLIVDPNTLGVDLLPAIVLGPVFAMKGIPRPQTGWRVLALACAAVSLVATIGTASRGAVVALAAITLLAPLIFWRWRRAVLGVLTVGAVLGFATLVTVIAPDARQHLSKSGSSGRTDVWVIGWRMVEDHPLRGVGPGNFRQESIHYLIRPGRYEDARTTERQLATPLVAHNSYLQVLTELGAVGLALYLAVATAAVACGLRAARIFRRLGQEALELAARGLVLALAGTAVAIWFITYAIQGRVVWVVMALLVVVYGLARRMERDASLPR